MRIIIETVPHNEQRYNTCGDWQWSDDKQILTIKVSEMKNEGKTGHGYMEAVIGIHELVEALACQHAGITEKMVDDFDKSDKYARECENEDIETGDHPKAPYKQQHTLATGIERILCFVFNIPWFEYESQLIEMTEDYKK